ncbi:interleukin-1 receptor-associated kinase 4 [Parasteatoda tepidariorum]|uniref:interleukin-1 receptor-associated kinase 4 n=1 Tax=Parasteatoda tepidariorum TaxID=114398 RepID=UPI001C7299D8|nr:interleukin-1 receptor-associated kinase 4 [Parasteatoda tepidariorum]
MIMNSCINVVLDLETKLRHLKLGEINQLSAILLLNDSWRDLAAVIRDPDNPSYFLYDTDNIRLLDDKRKCGKNPAEALLEHWGTYGKSQPNIKNLLFYLNEANLLRAVHFVKSQFLKNNIPETHIETEELETIINIENKNALASELNCVDRMSKEFNLDGITVYPFEALAKATMNFSERNGSKIGEGTYGMVFQGKVSDKIVAIKKLKNNVDKQFFTELNILSRFKHKNLLPLLGCSLTGSECCLVYEYMENGSLQDRLACLRKTIPLSFETRMKIAYESALGINHLHTFGTEPMVHRDIKSANILLDVNFSPKIGDFGLVRIGDSIASSTVAVTANVVGTSVYMAREAFNGDVSTKLDTFSFGVVLLELLTGLPPYDVNREDRDLTTFMEDCDDISTMLDKKVIWKIEPAVELHRIANFCLTRAKKKRPEIAEVLSDLQKCCSVCTAPVPDQSEHF